MSLGSCFAASSASLTTHTGSKFDMKLISLCASNADTFQRISAVRVDVDIHGIDGVLKTLESLPKEIVSKRGGPVARALAKGARLIRDEAKKNLRAQIAVNGDESTGLLEKNIIASRGKALRVGKGERYLVRVRRKTYPGRSGKPVTTRKTASLLEYGSEHQPATP